VLGPIFRDLGVQRWLRGEFYRLESAFLIFEREPLMRRESLQNKVVSGYPY